MPAGSPLRLAEDHRASRDANTARHEDVLDVFGLIAALAADQANALDNIVHAVHVGL